MDSDKIIDFFISHNATMEEVIQVRQYLDELINDSNKLRYLEAYGIDNTMAYEEAMHAYYNDEDEEE